MSHTLTKKRDETRFFSKVIKTKDCWLWVAGKDRCGYGKFRYSGKDMSAHRVAWELAYGFIEDGLYVLHKCDNPSCVNPSHLFLGTQRDNMKDMLNKKRNNGPQGSKKHNAKLQESQVVEILKDSRTMSIIAKEYGVHECTVSKIKLRNTWKHVSI